MNALTRTITLLAVVNLIVAGTLQAQNASDEEIQRALAVRQAQVAQKEAEVAQRQIELATLVAQAQPTVEAVPAPAVPPQPAQVNVSVPSVSFRGTWPFRSGAGLVLVIPTAELKMEELVTMTEDMTVMSRIFEKNLEQARLPATYGTLFGYSHNPFATLLGGGGGAMQSMYLQGYGALFLMKVDFPLSPPPQAEQKQEEETKKEETDPVWQQMRSEMYEPQEAGRHKAKEPQAEYDAEKVENLKTTLVRALKHAANIRSLKQDESVILAVAGSGESGGETAMITTRGTIVVDGHPRIVQQGTAPRSSQTVFVIRAKKSDIDSFAKDALDYEQFRQRTQLFSSPCLGVEAGRGVPFSRYY